MITIMLCQSGAGKFQLLKLCLTKWSNAVRPKEDTMEALKLGNVESQFADIIWNHEPIPSGELVKVCENLVLLKVRNLWKTDLRVPCRLFWQLSQHVKN